MNKPLIPFKDYRRIFNTIFSVLLEEDVRINHSCVNFSVIGSLILREKYKLDPKVYMGIAVYMIDHNNNNLLTFAEKSENQLIFTENGFHSWIVVNDWVIDFTAPLFPSMIKENFENGTCQSKMFQKPLNSMCASVADLKSNGDYFIQEDISLADYMMNLFTKSRINMDLAEICCHWYKKPPSKMKKTITISNGVGHLKQVSLKSNKITGWW